MAVATVVALGLTWGVAGVLGADGFTLRTALVAVAIGSVATLVPVLMKFGRDYWGVAVMFAGAARMMVSLGYCYFVRENYAEVLARPLFLSVGVAALLLLVVEVVTSVRILSALERERIASAPASTGGGQDMQRKIA